MINKIFYCILGFCLCFCLWTAFMPHQDSKFDTENKTDFSSNWLIQNDNGEYRSITLPTKLSIDKNTTISIKKTLPSSLTNLTCFCIRTSQQSLRAYIDDELVYEYGTQEKFRPYGRSSGSAWNIVRFPKGSEGKTLRLEICSPYSFYSGTINSVTLGTQAAITHSIYSDNIVNLIIALLICIFGIILILFYIIFRRYMKNYVSLYHLGWFSLLFSFWLLGECKMNQFFFGNQTLVFAITCFSLLLMAIPIINYMLSLPNFHHAKLMKALSIVTILNIIVLAVFITIFITILVETFYNHNHEFYYTAIGLGILCLSGTFEMIRFAYTEHADEINGVFVQIGVFLFIIIITGTSIRNILRSISNGRRTDYYKSLVTTDILTQCKNRTAYIEESKNFPLQEGCAAIITDINYLKVMNEEYGFHIGDQAIVRCSNFLQSVFGSYGNCYRIDGDEFLCLLDNVDEDKVLQCISEFSLLCQTENKKCAYLFQIATGYALFDSTKDLFIDNVVRRVEKNMLLNKRESKNIILS